MFRYTYITDPDISILCITFVVQRTLTASFHHIDISIIISILLLTCVIVQRTLTGCHHCHHYCYHSSPIASLHHIDISIYMFQYYYWHVLSYNVPWLVVIIAIIAAITHLPLHYLILFFKSLQDEMAACFESLHNTLHWKLQQTIYNS